MVRGILFVLALPLLPISGKVTVAPIAMPTIRPSGSPPITTSRVESAFEALGARDFRRAIPRADDTARTPVFERATFAIPSSAPAGGVLLYCGSDAAAADAAARFATQRPAPA